MNCDSTLVRYPYMGVVADGIVRGRLQIHIFVVSPQVAGVYGQCEPVISITQRIGFVTIKSYSRPAILALVSIPDYGEPKEEIRFLFDDRVTILFE